MLFGKPLRGLVSRLDLKFQASHRGSHSQFTADVSAMVEPARKLSRERCRLKKGFRKMAYSKFEIQGSRIRISLRLSKGYADSVLSILQPDSQFRLTLCVQNA